LRSFIKIENEMGGACSMNGRDKKCIQYLIGKPEVKRPYERPRRIWESNIRRDFTEIVWEVVDWIYLVQDRDQ
jgi:hypothetical protein